MVRYKSFCRQLKTFYGVTFRYGETKEVPGYIHDPRFVCLGIINIDRSKDSSKPKEVISESDEKSLDSKLLSTEVVDSERALPSKKEETKIKPTAGKVEKKSEKKEDVKTKAKDAAKKSAELSKGSDKKN